MDGVRGSTTRSIPLAIAPELRAYLRWLDAHPPLTFDADEYGVYADGYRAAVADADDIDLTPEERDLILLVRAEQAKRDARADDMKDAPEATP